MSSVAPGHWALGTVEPQRTATTQSAETSLTPPSRLLLLLVPVAPPPLICPYEGCSVLK